MNISIDPDPCVQWMSSHFSDSSYPRQVVVDFGRPGMRYCFEMRDLIHWTAYNYDTGFEGSIINHRTAVVLRSIVEEFYPYQVDEAEGIAWELEDAGEEVDLDFEDPPLPRVDVRLLGLTDGMVCVDAAFSDSRWSGHHRPHPVLGQNALATVDFVFPDAVVEKFGIRGIRVCVLELVCWLMEGAVRTALSMEANQEVWLDELASAMTRSSAAAGRYRTKRLQQHDPQQFTSASPGTKPPTEIEQEQMLGELAALI